MPKKILLADDSITIQKVVELTFAEEEDYQVVTVGDGNKAIAKIDEFRPDLVIADVVMPGMSGYDVCKFIKGNPKLSHVQVMLLRGTFEPFDQAKADACGNDELIVKPFESAALVKKVKALMEKARPSAEAAPKPAPTAVPSVPPAATKPPAAPAFSPFDEQPAFEQPEPMPAAATKTPGGGSPFEEPPPTPAPVAPPSASPASPAGGVFSLFEQPVVSAPPASAQGAPPQGFSPFEEPPPAPPAAPEVLSPFEEPPPAPHAASATAESPFETPLPEVGGMAAAGIDEPFSPLPEGGALPDTGAGSPFEEGPDPVRTMVMNSAELQSAADAASEPFSADTAADDVFSGASADADVLGAEGAPHAAPDSTTPFDAEPFAEPPPIPFEDDVLAGPAAAAESAGEGLPEDLFQPADAAFPPEEPLHLDEGPAPPAIEAEMLFQDEPAPAHFEQLYRPVPPEAASQPEAPPQPEATPRIEITEPEPFVEEPVPVAPREEALHEAMAFEPPPPPSPEETRETVQALHYEPPAALPAFPDIPESLIEKIVARVLERLNSDTVRDVAREVVPRVAERLIQDKIKQLEDLGP